MRQRHELPPKAQNAKHIVVKMAPFGFGDVNCTMEPQKRSRSLRERKATEVALRLRHGGCRRPQFGHLRNSAKSGVTVHNPSAKIGDSRLVRYQG